MRGWVEVATGVPLAAFLGRETKSSLAQHARLPNMHLEIGDRVRMGAFSDQEVSDMAARLSSRYKIPNLL